MKTITNSLGESITSWTSHRHPDNPNFMQVVRFIHVKSTDGRNTLYWRLFNSSENDKHMIPNITLAEAQAKFVDDEEKELTESDFEKWLSERNN